MVSIDDDFNIDEKTGKRSNWTKKYMMRFLQSQDQDQKLEACAWF